MKKIILAALVGGSIHALYSQNIGINANGTPPDNSAMLDVDVSGLPANNKKGLLIPRMTTTERNNIPSPANSLLIFNTTTNCYERYDATASQWITVHCGSCLNAPASPSMTGVGNATGASFQATWTPVTDATAYLVDVATDNAFTSIVSPYNNLNVGNSTSTIINNLNCGTTYYIRIRASNNCGMSAYSNTLNITTTTSAPSTPTAMAASNISYNGFTANWSNTPGATNYSIDVSTSPNFTSFVNPYNNFNAGNTTNINISSLSCNTTYYYRIKAGNSCNTSAYSNTITVTTSTSCPASSGTSECIVYRVTNPIQSSFLQDMTPTSDGGNIFLLYNNSVSNGTPAVLFKVDASYNVQWAKSTTSSVSFYYTNGKIVQTASGDYVVSGFASSGGGAICKLDGSGNFVWGKSVSNGSFSDITPTSDGGIAAVGVLTSSIVMVYKFDAAGSLQWSRAVASSTVGGSSPVISGHIIQASDGNLVTVCSYSGVIGGYSGYIGVISKLNILNGAQIWGYDLPVDYAAVSVAENPNGTFLVSVSYDNCSPNPCPSLLFIYINPLTNNAMVMSGPPLVTLFKSVKINGNTLVYGQTRDRILNYFSGSLVGYGTYYPHYFYLISPDGEVLWTKSASVSNSNNININIIKSHGNTLRLAYTNTFYDNSIYSPTNEVNFIVLDENGNSNCNYCTGLFNQYQPWSGGGSISLSTHVLPSNPAVTLSNVSLTLSSATVTKTTKCN